MYSPTDAAGRVGGGCGRAALEEMMSNSRSQSLLLPLPRRRRRCWPALAASSRQTSSTRTTASSSSRLVYSTMCLHVCEDCCRRRCAFLSPKLASVASRQAQRFPQRWTAPSHPVRLCKLGSVHERKREYSFIHTRQLSMCSLSPASGYGTASTNSGAKRNLG